jgi:hypothetical protein
MATKKESKRVQQFNCDICNFTTSRHTNWERHIMTRKHQIATKGNIHAAPLTCEFCNKEYKNRTGLWRHKQKCKGNVKNEPPSQDTSEIPDISKLITPDMIMTLLTQNQELMMSNTEFKQLIVEQQQTMVEQQNKIIEQQADNQKIQTQLLEVVKEGKTINNNTTNSNNKFNLNFFLNEQCKDAMNIADFVNNMVLTVEDLKKTGELGYIDGITKIFTDKLREMDTYNRPMHCTDLKRETLYIKNSDEWAKDTEDKGKIKRAIECVANKNLNNLDNWKDENPGHEVMDSKQDKEFVQIMTNSLGGMGSDREKNKQKIIKNVLKEIIVDR